jgi:hypothetical protein
MLRFLGAFLAFPTVSGAQQQTPGTEDARRQDIYAIYSVLMSNAPTGFASSRTAVAVTIGAE